MEETNKIDGRKATSIFKKEQRVTIKMRKWMQEYIKCGNAAEAARKVYNCSEANAKYIGYDNVKKMDYNSFLEVAGLTDALIVKKIIEGTNATKIHSSHTEPDKEVADYATRHKYIDTAARLRRRLTERDITIVSDKTLILDALGTNQEDIIHGQEEIKPLEGTTVPQSIPSTETKEG